jgi:hypothetical protein
MATTTAAATLSAAEQRATATLAGQYAVLAYAAWSRMASPDDVDANWLRILDLLIPQVLKGRARAATTARVYYDRFRKLEVPAAPAFRAVELPELDRQVIETSLRVTGPVAFKRKLEKISGKDLEPAVEKALTDRLFKEAGEQMASAVMRHVADGARQQILENVKADQVALGYLRVTKSTDPCFFCAMLASRGAVYGKESFEQSDSLFTGAGPAKAHDHCACTLEPVYSRSTELPDISREAAEIWSSTTGGLSGRQAIAAFRKAWESRS